MYSSHIVPYSHCFLSVFAPLCSIYVMGNFLSLVCRDGTSIVLSDHVGQIYILASGQGESQKDAQYDQVVAGPSSTDHAFTVTWAG